MVCQGKGRKFLLCQRAISAGDKSIIQAQSVHAYPLEICDTVPQGGKYPFHLMIQPLIDSQAAGVPTFPLQHTTAAHSPGLMVFRRNLNPGRNSVGILLLNSL